jgi:hypothetical protein
MWNFVSWNINNWGLFPETKFHIQKCDGLENIEKRSPALQVTLGSSTDRNLGHNQTKKLKKTYERNFGMNRILSVSSWPLIILNTFFSISMTWETHTVRDNLFRICQILVSTPPFSYHFYFNSAWYHASRFLSWIFKKSFFPRRDSQSDR